MHPSCIWNSPTSPSEVPLYSSPVIWPFSLSLKVMNYCPKRLKSMRFTARGGGDGVRALLERGIGWQRTQPIETDKVKAGSSNYFHSSCELHFFLAAWPVGHSLPF
uniref:Uncharacterized protein n=1 Tax=Utricularia reniformis TaxID=192314 RepID=A0A1Y0AZ29_9LAMI|nr:hypothetical protein AEK19_MT0834 [Utricularia reniformis]YP_009382303.1 hypothetical protein AEK19_MT1875 [Utricularia reniformis]ART30320.1 hypothetical protein AEK19_MT0834 [Utricularia reniformis]ART30413.1 hypothetical protein AEK19_MT1875 [Utricularia reniformis]